MKFMCQYDLKYEYAGISFEITGLNLYTVKKSGTVFLRINAAAFNKN